MKRNTPADATPADSRAALLEGYKSTQWTAFAFAMFCEFLRIFLEWGEAYVRVFFLVASLLAALFLRGVGIVGHNKADEAELAKAELKEEAKVLGEV